MMCDAKRCREPRVVVTRNVTKSHAATLISTRHVAPACNRVDQSSTPQGWNLMSQTATTVPARLPALDPRHSASLQGFNTFEASPAFRSILHDSPDRHRPHYRPARANCPSPPISLSRSVSPQRRSPLVKPKGRPWEGQRRASNGPVPEPVRVDFPANMNVVAKASRMDKIDPKLMSDYKARAKACRRAGRGSAEANALFNIGLLHEATGALTQAISAFKRHLEISAERKDAPGQAVSCNSIAAMYQKTGDLGTALKYHHMHLESADLQGKFVAHTNLGCVYACLGEHQVALEHHQHALRYAIRMESQTSQAIAVNNLGIVGGLSGDLSTAKACMERFLELSRATHNTTAAGIAYAHLADIATMQEDLPQARLLYHQARQVAKATGNLKAFTHASVQLGIVNGQMKFEDHMEAIRDRVLKGMPAASSSQEQHDG